MRTDNIEIDDIFQLVEDKFGTKFVMPIFNVKKYIFDWSYYIT